MNDKIVSVVAGGAVLCVTTVGVLKTFPAVLEQQTGYAGMRPLKKFADADYDKTTFQNFSADTTLELADALYVMRQIRYEQRRDSFRKLFKGKTLKQALPDYDIEAFKFADRLLHALERGAVLGSVSNKSTFFLRFVICRPFKK